MRNKWMTKGKVIAGAVILLALIGTFVWGGGYPKNGESPVTANASPSAISSVGSAEGTSPSALTPPALIASGGAVRDSAATGSGIAVTPSGLTPTKGAVIGDALTGGAVNKTKSGAASGEAAAPDQKKEASKAQEKPADRPGGKTGSLSAEEKIKLAKSMGGSSPGVEKGSKNYSAQQGMVIDSGTGKDKYMTDPVPEGKPVPVEPENVKVSDKKMTCTLSVRCDTILKNMKYLDPEKVELVPKDGVIFPAQKVTFYEGESVFNVLQREMKKHKIHMEFQNTPIYNSAYIEGINNLYEFDCGELSGWMYKVNGWFPNYGCSRYQLKQGDVVEWVYTCDLGRDVGGFSAVGE